MAECREGVRRALLKVLAEGMYHVLPSVVPLDINQLGHVRRREDLVPERS